MQPTAHCGFAMLDGTEGLVAPLSVADSSTGSSTAESMIDGRTGLEDGGRAPNVGTGQSAHHDASLVR